MRELDPYKKLAYAIVLQTVNDYRKALRGEYVAERKPEAVIKDCERFFRSEWFTMLTNVDGKMLIENLRKEVQSDLDKFFFKHIDYLS